MRNVVNLSYLRVKMFNICLHLNTIVMYAVRLRYMRV